MVVSIKKELKKCHLNEKTTNLKKATWTIKA
jgi:hypothetical protein